MRCQFSVVSRQLNTQSRNNAPISDADIVVVIGVATVVDDARIVLAAVVGRAQPPPAATAFCGALVCPGGLGVVRGDTDAGAVRSELVICGEAVPTVGGLLLAQQEDLVRGVGADILVRLLIFPCTKGAFLAVVHLSLCYQIPGSCGEVRLTANL